MAIESGTLSELLHQARDAEDVFNAFLQLQSDGARLILHVEGMGQLTGTQMALWRESIFQDRYVLGAAPKGTLLLVFSSSDQSSLIIDHERVTLSDYEVGHLLALTAKYLSTRKKKRRYSKCQLPKKTARIILNACQKTLAALPTKTLDEIFAVHKTCWLDLGMGWETVKDRPQAIACYFRQQELPEPAWARLRAVVALAKLLVRGREYTRTLEVITQTEKEPYRDFGEFGMLGLYKARALEELHVYDQARQCAAASLRRAWACYSPRLLKASYCYFLGYSLRNRKLVKLIRALFYMIAKVPTSPLFKERWAQIKNLLRNRGKKRILPMDSPPPQGEIHKIAVVRLDRLGDLVCSLPAIELLRRHYPDAEITAYVTRGLEFIVEQAGCCDSVVGVELDDKKAFKRAGQDFKNTHYDLVVDLLDIERSWEIAFLKGCDCKYKLGFDTRLRRWEFNLRIPTVPHRMHLMDQTIRLLRPLGIRPEYKISLPRLPLDPRVESLADALLPESTPDRPVVGIHCGSGYRFRYWPEEKFAAVADRLAKTRNARVVLLAGPDERDTAKRIAEFMTTSAELPKTASLQELAAVMKRLDILICMDTGPMHLAGAIGTSLVVLWGPGSVEIFKPLWPNSHIVCHLADCNGCPQEGTPRKCSLGYSRDETPCMSVINVDEVCNAACNAIDCLPIMAASAEGTVNRSSV